MNITAIFKQFPTQESCIEHLEKVRWSNGPVCPYCFSDKSAREKSQHRYHCNDCNTSYSVTVNTIFHDTKLPLQKWFLAISLILNAKKGISAKQLERDLDVTYKTAWYLAMRVRRAMLDDGELLTGIVEIDETYVGGKPRKGNKRGFDQPNKRGRGTKKTPVVGMVERGPNNKVCAMVQRDLTCNALTELVRRRVNTEFAMVITDGYSGYDKLNQIVDHMTVDHAVCYAIDEANTNTIEGFWAILKRGIIGQFHKVSDKFLPFYLAEFCYRYNNRKNNGLFDLTIANSVATNLVW
jgi:transposase-like protein